MRLAGVVLLFVGIIAIVVGTFSGCGTLFSWNGRHPVDVATIAEGHTSRQLTPEPGRRYTVSIQVVFDRESVETREAVAMVEAKLPLVVRVTDPHSTVRAETRGWLDPNEPPSVLYGQSVKDGARAELWAERLVGPFTASSTAPLTIDVDLGSDALQGARPARVSERRLVIYDDALPPKIRNAFILAAGGGIGFFAGSVLLVAGWFRRRGTATKRKRGGIPARDVV